jgi:hypothetical protein
VPWHGLCSLIHFLLCIFQEAFVVAVVLFFQPCAHIAACLTPMSWHALSCFQRLPSDKHKSCHVLPSPVTSTCRVMPCHVSSDCPPTSTSRAMAWPPQPRPFSSMHLSRSICRGLCILCSFMPWHFFSMPRDKDTLTSMLVHALAFFLSFLPEPLPKS